MDYHRTGISHCQGTAHKLFCDIFIIPSISLAYDCLLLMMQERGEKVELVSDEEQYRFIQRCKRGGLTQVLGPRLTATSGADELLQYLKPSLEVVYTHELSYLQLLYRNQQKVTLQPSHTLVMFSCFSNMYIFVEIFERGRRV